MGGLGDNDVVRHREFDRYREAVDRRLDNLERDVAALENEHDTDMDALATQRSSELQQATTRRERRREWTWGQIIAGASLIVATCGVAVALAALWLDALHR